MLDMKDLAVFYIGFVVLLWTMVCDLTFDVSLSNIHHHHHHHFVMIQVLGRESLRSDVSEKTASEWWSSKIGNPG